VCGYNCLLRLKCHDKYIYIMENTLIIVIFSIGGIFIGFAISKLLAKRAEKKKLAEAKGQSDIIIKEAKITAESIRKEKEIAAKEHFLKLKTDFDDENNRKKNQIISNENKIKQKESQVSKHYEQNKRQEAELES
jgi:ribonuclease Y